MACIPRLASCARSWCVGLDLAHLRLTPDNCHDLLFDDVIWVQEAQNEHYAFAELMRERGIEVVEMHDLLAETLELPEARSWVLDRKVNPNSVGRSDWKSSAPGWTRCRPESWPSS